jgi:hypothetical protein
MSQYNRFATTNQTPRKFEHPSIADKVVITPTMAKAWLLGSKDFRNRNLNHKLVKTYCETIKSGLWKYNGEPIILDKDGDVINGQHRLHAVVLSGINIESLVVYGVDRTTFDTMDKGRRRSNADVLQLAGYVKTRSLAGTASAFYHYVIAGDFAAIASGSKTNVSPVILRLFKEYPDLETSQRFIHNAGKRVEGLSPPAVIAALHYLFGVSDEEKRDVFFDDFIKNNITSGSSVYALIQANRSKQTALAMKSSINLRAAIWIKAWNAFSSGHSVSQLKWSQEHHTFPSIVGFDRIVYKLNLKARLDISNS